MILHIDMDAFFASVEQRDMPDLRGKCVIVGGTSDRGVVSAASYEARKFGIHSAMPIFKAKRLCPDGVFVRPDMAKYRSVSRKIMSLLHSFSPLVEVVSIDEAYLDGTGCERLKGGAHQMALAIKARIFEQVQLRCSIGIAPLRFLSKIASDMDKPDGLFVISPHEMMPFISALPIEKVPGVGRKTHRQFADLSISTLGEVKQYSSKFIVDRFGKFGRRLLSMANGIDETPITSSHDVKSISSEKTLERDTDDLDRLRKCLLQQSETVGRQLRKKGFRAKTVFLKIKHADFKQVTRNRTLMQPTRSTEAIYREALRILSEYEIHQKIRLIGVGVGHLVSEDVPVQVGLFNNNGREDDHWEKVDKTVDAIEMKFGLGIIRKAAMADKTNQ